MTIIQSFILGLIQALTEFLPISSSAHLKIFPWIFGWKTPESFEVALHLGTLLAICVYFFKDWIRLISSGFELAFNKKKSKHENNENVKEGKIFWYLVIATIPAGILSLILDWASDKIINGNILIEMGLIAIALVVLGIVLYIVDKKAENKYKYEDITLKQSLLIRNFSSYSCCFSWNISFWNDNDCC